MSDIFKDMQKKQAASIFPTCPLTRELFGKN